MHNYCQKYFCHHPHNHPHHPHRPWPMPREREGREGFQDQDNNFASQRPDFDQNFKPTKPWNMSRESFDNQSNDFIPKSTRTEGPDISDLQPTLGGESVRPSNRFPTPILRSDVENRPSTDFMSDAAPTRGTGFDPSSHTPGRFSQSELESRAQTLNADSTSETPQSPSLHVNDWPY